MSSVSAIHGKRHSGEIIQYKFMTTDSNERRFLVSQLCGCSDESSERAKRIKTRSGYGFSLREKKNPNLPLEDRRKYLKTVCTFEMIDTEFSYYSEKLKIQQENSDTVSEMKSTDIRQKSVK